MGSPSRFHSGLRRWIIGGALVLLAVWLLFFDSHSLLKRYRWSQELDRLQTQNAQLRANIDRLQTKLDEPLSDSLVEHIAREEYGMKRSGETVYRTDTTTDAR